MFELITLVCAAFFAGASAYITFVEHPARVSCGATIAVMEFRPSYRRATVMQASLAIVGFLSSVVAFLVGRSFQVLVAGLLLGSVVPFTLLVIFPTNKQLLDASLDTTSPIAVVLLRRWGLLHAVRTVVSTVAFAIALAHLAIT